MKYNFNILYYKYAQALVRPETSIPSKPKIVISVNSQHEFCH